LPDQIAQGDAKAIEMFLDTRGEEGTGGSAAGLGESPEQQAAANFAGGVLHGGQAELLGLPPVARDVVEILGIGADLLKQGPESLNAREILFALIFAAAFFDQSMRMPDAFQCVVTDAQIELANKPPCAEGG
jgi:hypothetical protein